MQINMMINLRASSLSCYPSAADLKESLLVGYIMMQKMLFFTQVVGANQRKPRRGRF